MDKLKNSIILANNEIKKSQNKSIDCFLNLPLKSLNQTSPLLLNFNNIKIQEKIAVVFLLNLQPFSQKNKLIEKYNKYNEDGNYENLSYIDNVVLKNYIGQFNDLNIFINFMLSKLLEEGIEINNIKKEYDDLLLPYNNIYNIIKKLNNINIKTEKFFKHYSNIIDSDNIFEDYLEFMGEQIEFLSKIENIIPYTNIKYLPNDSYQKFYDITEKAFKELGEKNEKYLPKTFYFSKHKDKNTDISSFIFKATIEDNKIIEETFPLDSNINKYIYFNDNSSLIEYKNGEIENFSFSEKESREFVEKLEIEYINCLLKKKPHYLKFFKAKFNEETEFKELIICIEMFLKNEQILKNSKINIIELKDRSIESIYDLMIKKEKEYKVEQMCKSITSNKYKDLFNSSTRAIVSELYDKGISTTSLQNYAGKKLALFKNSNELNKFLDNILNDLSEFSSEKLSAKLSLMDIEPISTEDNIYIFEVKNFAQSNSLGSNSWCISREEFYFDDYVNNEAKQYFIYDFNKNELDNESMIGITLFDDGHFSSQHLKDDDYVNVNDYLKNIRKKIFDKKINDFHLCKEVEEEYKEKNKKTIKNGIS